MAHITITKNQLINIAIESVKTRNNLSYFWEYVNAARGSRLLKMSDESIKLLLDEYDHLVHSKGFESQEQLEKLPDTSEVYGRELWRDGRVIEGSSLDGYLSKAIDISPLRTAIPNYMDVIQPRPLKVYLIDDLKFWTLFKVVGIFRIPQHFTREVGQLYLVGKDRHTQQPFALGIPNGFIDQPFEACLRWTLDAHRGDIAIEV